uniref:G-protein coupled receptors family 3 profile domain-containing protein n=1 Tax=Leptobrachium leishanense TaxID=445787 RepID=A0A8C5MM97_9ANUR
MPAAYSEWADKSLGAWTLFIVAIASWLLGFVDPWSRMCFTKIFSFFSLNIKYYQNLMAFIFAISEINQNPEILPNVTLGFYTVDPCFNEAQAVKGMIGMFSRSTSSRSIPNYHCGLSSNLVGFVDGISPSLTLLSTSCFLLLFTFLFVFQISYSSMDPILSDKVQFPYFYRTVPNEIIQYKAIVSLMKYFGWSWVGILVADNESGLMASQEIQRGLSQHGYCVEFVEYIQYKTNVDEALIERIVRSLRTSTANVIIIYAARDYVFHLVVILYMYPIANKIWIISSQWGLSEGLHLDFLSLEPFNGSLAFTLPAKTTPNFEEFSKNINPGSYPNDIFIDKVWMELYDCNYRRKSGDFEICIGNETIKRAEFVNIHKSMTQYSYSIYNAVYALAHALHLMTSPKKEDLGENGFPAWKVSVMSECHNIKNSLFDILNWVVFADQTLDAIKVGQFHQQTLPDLMINEEKIRWDPGFEKSQHSVCSESCIPGYRKSHRESQPSCCYDCVPCVEGEISNETDMGTCTKCPDHLWSNTDRDTCIPKAITYLSYEDILGMSLAVVSIVLFLLTCLVTMILMKHRNTPVVKANNRNLSFILLISLKMCFLCSLIFIGYPHKVTCILRQTVFGITFSISVSAILAKTVTVVIAFNATNPRSRLKHWVGTRTSYSVLLICSSIQLIICVIWLGSSPPFPQENMQDEVGKIVAECNDGSQVAFYSVLGYMGFLAFVSFLIAFLARNLPDAFNEAKYITFSMLVFCSVWISFIPAYLSSKGKNVVAVEIFAILASGFGLLGCIFIPKCYVILIKPELNSKMSMVPKKA